jgi:hypothetical protein
MAFRLSGKIHWGLWVLLVIFATPSHAQIPLPAGSKIYSYPSTELPVVNADPSQAKPVGVGDVTSAHDLALRIGLDSFSGPVDIYVAIHAPAVSPDLFLFRPDGSLAPASSGLSPWKAGTTGPVNEGLLGTIPLSLIPSGDYAFYLLAAPAGTEPASIFANCYLWVTSVGNLRVLDVSEKAALLFGGDVKGAAAIIMGLGNDYSIENVANAVMRGTLTEYGEILAATTAKQTLTSRKPSFCEPEQSAHDCREALIGHLDSLSEGLEEGTFNDVFEKVVTAYTLYLSSVGYSGSQIHLAIWGHFVTGELFINYNQSVIGLPFGGIMVKKTCDGTSTGCGEWEFVRPAIELSEIGALFSDLDPEDFDISDGSPVPSIEGMTFPAYFKGTGTARHYQLVKSWGTYECTLNDVVFVARVGGMGDLEKTLEVFMNKQPYLNRSGAQPKCDIDMPVQGSLWQTVKGEYTSEGIHHDVTDIKEVEPTYTVITYEESDIKFNKQFLWGNVYRERGIPQWEEYSENEYDFRLEAATEAEFKAVYPNY